MGIKGTEGRRVGGYKREYFMNCPLYILNLLSRPSLRYTRWHYDLQREWKGERLGIKWMKERRVGWYKREGECFCSDEN